MLIRPLVRSVVSPLVRSVTTRGRRGIDPAAQALALFAAGEPGLIYDNSRLDQMWQDAAKTTAAAVGQPVGFQSDLSGRGNHRQQTDTTKRPILRQDANGKYYLERNGTNQWMVTIGSVNLSASDKAAVVLGVRKESDAALAMLIESSATYNSNVGSFAILGPSSAGTSNYAFGFNAGTAGSRVATTYAAPHMGVLAVLLDAAATGTDPASFPRTSSHAARKLRSFSTGATNPMVVCMRTRL